MHIFVWEYCIQYYMHMYLNIQHCFLNGSDLRFIESVAATVYCLQALRGKLLQPLPHS